MCPDWDLNQQPFGAQEGAPTEAPGQGPVLFLIHNLGPADVKG